MKLQDFLPHFVLQDNTIIFSLDLSDLYVSKANWSNYYNFTIFLRSDHGERQALWFNDWSLRYDIRSQSLIASGNYDDGYNLSQHATPPIRGVSWVGFGLCDFKSKEKFFLDENRRMRLLQE